MSEAVERPGSRRSLARRLLDVPRPASGARGQLLLNERHTSLTDAVDHLLNRGAVLVGDATLSLGGVDLVYLGLTVMLSSVETLRQNGIEPLGRRGFAAHLSHGDPPMAAATSLGASGSTAGRTAPDAPRGDIVPGVQSPGERPSHLDDARSSLLVEDGPVDDTGALTPQNFPDDEGPERGLAKLVLTLVELLREILERQAVRRMDGGGLSEQEIERMGMALAELKSKMTELREVFGLEEADLNIDLGPLGKLM